MSKCVKPAALIALAIVSAPPPFTGTAIAAQAPTADAGAREADFRRELDRFVETLRATPDMIPGTAVVVVHGDRTVFEKAYGTRDNRTNAPLTLDTPMYNGSVTKAYTGVLAAILDAEGTLPLSASIKDVWGIELPAPLDAEAITAERLLSHNAEIFAGGLNFRSVNTGQIDARAVPAHLARFAKPHPTPGFVYNNWNPFIWSAMAEARTGTPWRELLQEKLLRPLGMKHSTARIEDFGADGVARCHPRVKGAWRSDPPKPTAILNAAGGMYTSPRDAADFIKLMITDGASADGRIPAAVLRRSWKRAADQDKDIWGMHRDGYGLGWDLGSFDGRRFVARSGGYMGCRAISMFLPEMDLGIVAMSNGGIGANTVHAAIFAQAIDLWTKAPDAASRGEERIRSTRQILAQAIRDADAGDPRLANTRPINPAQWRSVEGAYRNDRLGDGRIALDGSTLRLSIGVLSVPLLHVSGDSFLVSDDPEDKATTFSFVRDDDGRVIAFLMDDDRYDRVAADAAAASTAGLDLDLPFELVRNRIFVPAYVNGQGPLRFMVDTGASGFGRADVALVSRLGIPKTGTTDNSDGVNSSKIDVVRVGNLRLGDLERSEVELLSRDYNRGASPGARVDGIFGRGFFADGTLTIDFPSRRLRFSRSERLVRGGPGILPYDRPFFIPIQIGARRATGAIDTGSSLSMHLPMALLEQIEASPPEPAGTARRANTVFHMYESVLAEPVQIGSFNASSLRVSVSREAPVDHVNIGLGLLGKSVLKIDQVSKLVAILPASAGTVRPTP